MEVAGLNGGSNLNDKKALKGLLEVFGPSFSLDQIASAYCKAGKNADDAAEALALALALSAPNVEAKPREEEESSLLSNDNVSKKPYQANGYWRVKSCNQANGTTLAVSEPNGEAKPRGEEESSRLSNANVSKKPYQANGYWRENSSNQANGNSRASKTKCPPVSVGSVSSIIGKQYVRKAPSANGASDACKPLKLDSTVLPMSEIWEEKDESNSSSRDDRLHLDTEDFLFSMLGDGFALERDRIRQVLDSCGYDMEKSMEKLMNFSASTPDKRNKLVSKSNDKPAGLCLESEVSSDRKCKTSTEGNRASITNGVEFTGQQKKRDDLQKEVLAALFGASERPEERPEELPRRTIKAGNKYGAYVVVEPPNDFLSECKSAVVYQQHHGEDDADDVDNYNVLRKNVKEYRSTMKDYYQAAAEAFAKDDHDRANKLLEKGRFFFAKACDADEESNKMILKTRNAETEAEIVLDLNERSGNEAIRLLKSQISSFSGISSFMHLKAIIDTKEEDISKGSRKRLQVLKLLQDESIKWTEGENAGTILIQLHSVNRKLVSFIKKP